VIRRESFGQMEQQSQYTYRTQAVEEQKQDPLDRLAKLTDLKQKDVIMEKSFKSSKQTCSRNYEDEALKML
jgi:hypothetical protein